MKQLIYTNPSLLILYYLYLLCRKFLSPKGKSLIVLGMQGAGKTTFYKRLSNNNPDFDTNVATSLRDYEEFTFKTSSNREIKIRKGKDIGGGDEFCDKYPQLIKDSDNVLFIFDVSKYLSDDTSYQKATHARLHFIYFNKGDKNIYIIGSHADRVSNASYPEVANRIIKMLKNKSYKELFDRNFVVLNLCNDYEVSVLIDKIFSK